MYSFPSFEPVSCSMFDSNCCFLTCIQVPQEAGEMAWYSHLFKNFPQIVVIHTVKGCSTVDETVVDVFLGRSFFFYDPTDVGNLISGSSAFSKCNFSIWEFTVHVQSRISRGKSTWVKSGGNRAQASRCPGVQVFHWGSFMGAQGACMADIHY